MVQWVRLHAPNAGGLGSIPGGGTRSRTHAATKSLHAATKGPTCHNEDPWQPKEIKKKKLSFEMNGICFCICKGDNIVLFGRAEGRGSRFLIKDNKTIKRNKHPASVGIRNADLRHSLISSITAYITLNFKLWFLQFYETH